MADASRTVVLKPDRHGMQAKLFAAYTGRAEEQGALDYAGFDQLLSDLALPAGLTAQVVAADVFSVRRGCRDSEKAVKGQAPSQGVSQQPLTSSSCWYVIALPLRIYPLSLTLFSAFSLLPPLFMQGVCATEAKVAGGDASTPLPRAVTWRYFPNLLSEVALAAFSELSSTEARQRLMHNHVVPLVERVGGGYAPSAEREAAAAAQRQAQAAAQFSHSRGGYPSSAGAASPLASRGAGSGAPTPARAVAPDPSTVPGADASSLGSRGQAGWNAYGSSNRPTVRPLPSTPGSAARRSAAAGAAASSSPVSLFSSSGAHARPAFPAGVTASASASQTLPPLPPMSQDEVLAAVTPALAASTADVPPLPPAEPDSPPEKVQWSSFLARQTKALAVKANKVASMRAEADARLGLAGPDTRRPRISAGSRRILAELDMRSAQMLAAAAGVSSGSSAGVPDSGSAGGAAHDDGTASVSHSGGVDAEMPGAGVPEHEYPLLQRAVLHQRALLMEEAVQTAAAAASSSASRGHGGRRDSAGAASSVSSSVGTSASAVAGAAAAAAAVAEALAGGQALYRNALNRQERQRAALEAALAAERAVRDSKKTLSRSDALMRRRLTREVAAAAVYVAASALSAAALSPSSPETVRVPWWECPLAPADVSLILYHSGFLSGPVLAPHVAQKAVELGMAARAAAAAASAAGAAAEADGTADEVGATGAAASSSPAEEAYRSFLLSLPGPLVESTRLLVRAWGEAARGVGGSSTEGGVGSPTHLPAVRLLALLHALVTSGYDVRTSVLIAAATRDLGLPAADVMVPLRTAAAAGLVALPPTYLDDQARLAAAASATATAAATGVADIPALFVAALSEHRSRLHSLGEASPADAAAAVAAAAAAAAGEAGAFADSVADAIEGRLTWPVAALGALRRLYTNRLGYLGRLARTDTLPAISVLPLPTPGGESASRGRSRSVSVSSAGRDAGASAGVSRSLSARGGRLAAPASAAAAADRECTFAPKLCRKSLEIAASQTVVALAGLSPDAAAATTPAVATATPGLGTTATQAVPRELHLLRYGAEVDARLRAKRAQRAAAELEGCTFRPDTTLSNGEAPGSTRARGATRGSGRPGTARSASASSASSRSLSYVPPYASQAALMSRGAEADPALLAAITHFQASFAAEAAEGGGAPSRTDWLFHLASVRSAVHSAAAARAEKARAAAEVEGCTFKPDGDRARREALVKKETPVPGEVPVVIDLAATARKRRAGSKGPVDAEAALEASSAAGEAESTGAPPLPAPVPGPPPAPGLDTFMRRMQKVHAERNATKVLDQALHDGKLHIVKPALHGHGSAPASKATSRKASVASTAVGTASVGDAAVPAPVAAAPPMLPHPGALGPWAFPPAYPFMPHPYTGAPHAYPPMFAGLPPPPAFPAAYAGAAAAAVAAPAPLPASVPSSPHARPVEAPPTAAEQLAAAAAPGTMDLSSSSSSPAGPPLMFVDIAVTPELTERVPVWRDSDLGALAAAFVDKHGLPKKMARRLERMLATQRDSVTGTAAAAPAPAPAAQEVAPVPVAQEEALQPATEPAAPLAPPPAPVPPPQPKPAPHQRAAPPAAMSLNDLLAGAVREVE